MRLFIIFFTFFFIVSSPSFADMETAAKQAIIIDYDTGQVLFEKNADERMPTSSMSKVMTIYLIFEALQNGQIELDTRLLVSEKAWRKGGSKMFIKVADKVRVEDLIRGVVIQSGNDATIALAEGIAGSEELFAAALNRKAKEIGMKNTNLVNASGWPDPNHYSTARDLAIMARSMIRNFPEYYHYYGEKRFRYADITQDNRNPLLYAGLGADGLKTGHTDSGGYGLIGTAVTKEGRRVIMVLNGMKSKQERKSESSRLMQWALKGFKSVSLFSANNVLDYAPVYLGQQTKVPLVARDSINIILPILQIKDIQVDVEYHTPIKAPVSKGQELGQIFIKIPNNEDMVVPLIANRSVDEMPFILRAISKARIISTGQGQFE